MTAKQNNHRGQMRSPAHPKARKSTKQVGYKASHNAIHKFSSKKNKSNGITPGATTGYVGIQLNSPKHREKEAKLADNPRASQTRGSSGFQGSSRAVGGFAGSARGAAGGAARGAGAAGGFAGGAGSAAALFDTIQPYLTRRNFIIGAVGVGALAAGGIAFTKTRSENVNTVPVLEVPESRMTNLDSLTEAEADTYLRQIGNYELDYGTLVLSNDENVAVCLLPTESSNPLTQIGILNLNSGMSSTVVENAEGADEGFVILDAKGNINGLIWVESNVLKNEWRVYAAPFNEQLTLGKAVMVDNAGADWETPSLAVAGKYAFWQVLPKTKGTEAASPSRLHKVKFGSSDKSEAYSSPGRMATFPQGYNDRVVITPRLSSDTKNYQLTLINAESGAIEDTLTLPSGMTPLTAGYGKTGFNFSFDAIYNYGEGIANLGTYTPSEEGKSGYSKEKWFCFNRTPDAPAAWCGELFIVKSTTAVCGVSFRNNTFFALQVADGADDYGEYLSNCEAKNTLVTFTNIDYSPIDGDPKKLCQVRVWTANETSTSSDNVISTQTPSQ